MRCLRLTLLLAILFSASLSLAERLPLKIYTVADGLANNEVNKIVRDSRGFLWFCTGEGLSRFDGYNFTNYGTDQGLPHPQVNDIIETRTGEYWVATNGGLVHFNPKGRQSNQVVYSRQPEAANQMFSVVIPADDDRKARAVTVLVEDKDGTIWCGTYKGLYRLVTGPQGPTLGPIEIGIPSQYPEQRIVSDLLVDEHNSLWIATPNGIYRHWPDGAVARYTKRDGLPDDFVQDLFQDHQGRLWAGTRFAGFFQLVSDEKHGAPRIANSYGVKNGLPTAWVFQLFETSAHKFWIATAFGLVEFFPEASDPNRRLHGYTTRNGLTYHDITALNEDVAGNLWLGSYAGVMKFARNGFVTYDERDGLVELNSIFEDHDGAVCFRGYILSDSSERKKSNVVDDSRNFLFRLGRFDGQAFNWFIPSAIDHPGWVGEGVTLQRAEGDWWLGTGVGVYRFPSTSNFTNIRNKQPLAVYRVKEGLAADQIYRLFEDTRGDVWISTIDSGGNGLARWDHESHKILNLAGTQGLPSLQEELAHSFGEDNKGDIFIGFGSGLARYTSGSFTFLSTQDGLPAGGIQYIYSDHAGRLWLASSRGGLVRIDDPGAAHLKFVSYTTSEGLSSNSPQVIVEDLQGFIYVGSGRGLDQLDPATGRFKHFTTADGLAAGAFLAAFRDRSGSLWFGTQKGLSRFTPVADEAAAAPPILISSLQVGGAQQLVSALGDNQISLPELSANRNQLRVDYVGLSYATGEVLRYQYKLEGADLDWSAPTEQRSVNYANLASGNYRFLVRAVSSRGLASASPAVVTFTILPPLWERWWFVAALTAIFVGIAYAAYRYRIDRLVEMTNMRTRIATDLHDDIGANLTRISLLSEVAKQQLGNGNSSPENPLGAIARIARESVGSMSDIVWAINPERETLVDLTRKMRQHADEVFTLRDIELNFTTPDPRESLRLKMDVRRDLLLIFKEAVNNAARHSRCSRVDISFRVEGSKLVLKIVDDGVGFNTSLESEGHGLRSMKRRATALGGSFDLHSTAGKETVVEVAVPLDRAHRSS